MSNLDKIQNIIAGAGGKTYRRPYDYEEMQELRDKIHDVVSKWAKAGPVGGYGDGGKESGTLAI